VIFLEFTALRLHGIPKNPLKREISLVSRALPGDLGCVKFTQKLLFLVSSLGLSAGAAHAQTSTLAFSFEANSVANYRQTPLSTNFEGGTFGLNVRDGNFVYVAGCDAPFFFNPSPGCPPGASGFVSRGLQNDPLLTGRGPYFSVTEIAAALILNPFDAQSARLIAAPPSLLPRPQLGFEDRSISVFFNLLTNFIRQYPISVYSFQREYAAGERARFDGEVVPGTYRYNFGSLQNPIVPVVLEVNQFPMLDGFRKVNNQPRGLRFTNVTYDDGFAVLDPFALNTLTWEGNTISFISPQADVAYLSIKPLADPTDPLSDPLLYDGLGEVVESPPGSFNFIPNPTLPLFPNFSGPNAARVLLPNPLNTSFILPPNFVEAGETGVVDLEFVVFRPTSNLIFESSIRRFRLPVKVLNPFDGFILGALPLNTTALQRSADFDFDGDGVSNFTEWVFGSDPAKRASVPPSPGVRLSGGAPAPAPLAGTQQLSRTQSETQSTTSSLEYRVPKLTNPVPKLKYAIEHSTDMVTWTEIKSGDPNWILQETHKEIKVTESGNGPKTGGFFRAKVLKAN